MKAILPILLLLSLSSCAPNTCLWKNNEDEEHHRYSYANEREKLDGFEIIDMGGVSSLSANDFSNRVNRFLRIDTKAPKKRFSNREYKDFELSLTLNANDDTGDDRFSVFVGDSLIYTTPFHDGDQKIAVCFSLSKYSNLKFIVDNIFTRNHTPGAFQATIKIRDKNSAILSAFEQL